MKQCKYCGNLVPDDSNYCARCGREVYSEQPPQYAPGSEQSFRSDEREAWYANNNPFDSDPVSGKSRGIAALLALIVGTLGVQYFYLNRVGAGLLTILLCIVTCGVWSIVVFVQGILLLVMSNREFVRKFIDTNNFMPLF